ncbi:hypothetical protein OFB65_25605, partial [Escherichia coli]|nr:hypothetical protein [Escherichia coli]
SLLIASSMPMQRLPKSAPDGQLLKGATNVVLLVLESVQVTRLPRLPPMHPVIALLMQMLLPLKSVPDGQLPKIVANASSIHS